MITVVVDGAARGQGTPAGGEAALGVAIYKNNKLLGQYARGLGRRTNNEAEYEAVLAGVLLCWAGDLVDPIIYSDSAVVVKQVNGVWECRTESLRTLLLSIREIQEVFRFRLVQVPRKMVAEADHLANLFLDKLAAMGDTKAS